MNTTGRAVRTWMLCVLSAVLLVMSFATSAQAGTYYVAKTGNDTNPGTEAQPWLTIAKAANTLVAGDTVYVKAGTYLEKVAAQNSGTAGNYITYSAYPGDTVIIDSNGIAMPAWWEGTFTILGKGYIKVIGFQCKNSASFGILVAGLEDTGAPPPHHVEILNNYTYNTVHSGIGNYSGNNTLIQGNEVELACNGGDQECISIASDSYDVQVLNNHVHHDGAGVSGGEGIDVKDGAHDVLVKGNYVHDLDELGIYCDSWDSPTYNVTIDSNRVHNCAGVGIALSCEMGGPLSNVTVSNNVVYNEDFGIDITNWMRGYPHPMDDIKIINNTLYNNGYGIWHRNGQATNVVIRNNIFSPSTGSGIVYDSKEPVTATVDHNLFQGTSGVYGTDYLLGDPQFVSAATLDFHLQSTSPAINAGSSVSAPAFDYDGNARPSGAAFDIGAFEFPLVPVPPVANFTGNPTSGPAPLTVAFTDTSTGAPTSWSWTFGDGGTSTAQSPSHIYALGTFSVSLTATNALGSDGETKTNYITATAPPTTLFSDGFEANFDKWTDGGVTDWDRAIDQKYTDSYSAHAGSADNDLISDNINTTGYSSITIDFWYRDDDIDDNDDIYLQLYNGSIYANKFELGNSTEDTWNHCTITLSNSGADVQYFIASFRIKFEGSSIDVGENLWIDDVVITASP